MSDDLEALVERLRKPGVYSRYHGDHLIEFDIPADADKLLAASTINRLRAERDTALDDAKLADEVLQHNIDGWKADVDEQHARAEHAEAELTRLRTAMEGEVLLPKKLAELEVEWNAERDDTQLRVTKRLGLALLATIRSRSLG